MSLDQFGTMDQTRGDWHFQGHHRWLGSLARTRVSLQLSAISDGHVAEHAGPGASHFRNKLVFSGWWNPLSHSMVRINPLRRSNKYKYGEVNASI